MAEVNTGGGGEAKKGKPKKMQLRVDFTPMVDMNMLLITFFMFCTTLSKPQMMKLVVPTKDKKELTEDDKNQVNADNTVTVLLGENDKVYYYAGKPDYENWQSLIETNYSPEGLREYIVKRNAKAIRKMYELRQEKQHKKISDEDFDEESKKIRSAKDGLVVIIKPTEGSTYKNLVEVLDEMQICSVGTYAIVEIAEADKVLIQNYMEKGALTAHAANAKK